MRWPIQNVVPYVASLTIIMGGLPLSSLRAEPNASLTPEAVAERLSGLLVYQLEGDRQIHMTTCRVSKAGDTDASLYLYQEQARDDKLDQPYRQRFLSLKAISPNQVASVSYRPVE